MGDCLNMIPTETRLKWVVTGAAGFIGSHLADALLSADQRVVVLDNFLTGSRKNIDYLEARPCAKENLRFIEGDIRKPTDCDMACAGADVLIHLAALGSVPRSVKDPVASNSCNVDGFIEILLSARRAGIKRVVYASSSSVYGSEQNLPKVESRVGVPLSPYAASKAANESYAHAFAAVYGLECIGLRFFNVFGARQNPDGDYAAVIPRWAARMVRGEECEVYGDGSYSRDFCYVDNAIQAAVRGALTQNREALNQVYNIACGARTTLIELHQLLAQSVQRVFGRRVDALVHKEHRPGDVPHSLADISKAQQLLGYVPAVGAQEGLERYVRSLAA